MSNAVIVHGINTVRDIYRNGITHQYEVDKFQLLFRQICDRTTQWKFNPHRMYTDIEAKVGIKYRNKFGVFSCKYATNHKELVVKEKTVNVPKEDLAGRDDMFRQNFFECYFVDKLCTRSHPNIVKVVNMWAAEKVCKIYIEFEPAGEGLDVYIHRVHNNVPIVLARRLIKHALSALSYCHANRIIHCDVSDKNFLIDQRNVLRLCDFDMARHVFDGDRVAFDESHQANDMRLRPAEVLLFHPFIGPGVDIFALACVIVRMVGNDAEAFEDFDATAQLVNIQRFSGPLTAEMANAGGNKDIAIDSVTSVKVDGLRAVFPELPTCATLIDLLNRMFDIDQNTRVSAAMALTHPFFFV